MARSHQKSTARDVLRIAFQRRKLFVSSALVFIVVVLAGALYVPLKYTGVTKFERRSEGTVKSTDSTGSFDVMKVTLEMELSGLNAVYKVIEDLELTKDLPHGPDGQLTQEGQMSKQSLAEAIMRNIEVAWEARSDIVDVVAVSFTHNDPLLAERLPNLLVANYVNRASEQIVERLTASRDFLQGKFKDCSARMDQILSERTAFEVRHAGMLPESPGALKQNIQLLTDQIENVQYKEKLARDRLTRLQSYTTSTAPAIAIGSTSMPTTAEAIASASQPVEIWAPNATLQRLKDELQAAKDQLTVLQLNRLETHPLVVDQRRKIEMLEKRIEETPADVPILQVKVDGGSKTELAMQIMTAQSELEVAGKELARLRIKLNAYQDGMMNFGPVRQEYAELVKRYDEAHTETVRWQQALTEVQMSLAAEVAKRRTHLNTVQAAQKQLRPSSPSLMKVFAFALLGGLCFGVGLTFLTNSLDRSIRTSEEAASYFDIPVYGTVGKIVTARDLTIQRLRRWVITPLALVVILVVLGFCGTSITLWLTYPQKYSAWRAAPVSFVYSELTAPAGGK